MLTKSQNNNQNELFRSRLESIINLKKPLCTLSTKINWSALENSFTKYYSKDFGRPSKPIRLMVSLLILKHLYNMSDESVVERWSENPYWQYFSGMEYFQWELPCDPTELVKFRNRIGESGVEEIFKSSIEIHGKDAMEKEVIQDTTVQEKNITFPTDSKLHIKIIKACLKLANSYNIKLRQTYTTTLKKLRWSLRYLNNPKRRKEAIKAMRKIKTIAGRLVREILRKLSPEQIAKHAVLARMQQILNQKRTDKNKLYSLHEPDVACIAKGKEHKKYEFGSKVSITITKTNSIIVGAMNFLGNPYDGNTLEPALEQVSRLRGEPPKKVLLDEGFRGRERIGAIELIRAHRNKNEKSNKKIAQHSKYKRRKWFNRRAAIEPIIGHLKSGYRLGRNFLKGRIGDSINLMLAAAAFNINKWLKNFIFWLFSIFYSLRFNYPIKPFVVLFQG